MPWNYRIALPLVSIGAFLSASCTSTASADSSVSKAQVCPVRKSQPLRFVEVFDGPVEELAILVPDVNEARSGYWRLGYVYESGRTVTIRCKYADGQMQDVKLSDRVEKCSYRVDRKKTLSVSCQ